MFYTEREAGQITGGLTAKKRCGWQYNPEVKSLVDCFIFPAVEDHALSTINCIYQPYSR